MKFSIWVGEEYPVYSIYHSASPTEMDDIEISDDKLEWINKIEVEYGLIQRYLANLLEEYNRNKGLV